MTSRPIPPIARDFYVATHSDVRAWGGGTALTSGLAGALQQRGYTALVLGIGENHAPPATAAGAPADRAVVEQHNLSPRLPARAWRVRNWLIVPALARALAGLPPPRLGFIAVNPIWVLAARRAWPSVPVTFHFAASLTNCLPFAWNSRPTVWQRLDWLALRRIERRALACADRILAPTAAACDELAALEPAARKRMAVCRYGVAPPPRAADREPQRNALGLAADDCVFLLLGVCDRNKAFDLAVHAMPTVDARGHLVIVGDGPERGALHVPATKLGVAQRVHILGSQPDVEPWYAAADCVLSTSHYDTFPYALLDAMARGRPVVVPRHDPPRVYAGVAEVVAQSGGGYLYDRDRPGALAECLNEIIRTPATRAATATQARRIAEQQFRWDASIEQILETCDVSPPRRPGYAAPPAVAREPHAEAHACGR